MQSQLPSPGAVDDVSKPVDAGPAGAVDTGLEREVAQLIVETLNLEIEAQAIDPQGPLFGDGLGLDSIDILEVALVVSKKYGFQLRSDDDDNVRIFQSLRSLSQHIGRHRVK